MLKPIRSLKHYMASESGATAIEYGLIAGGISLAIVAAVFAFGDDLQSMFEALGPAMNAVNPEVESGR